MHNMASPFTNTIMSHSFLSEKNASGATQKPTAVQPAPSASTADQPEVKRIAQVELSRLEQLAQGKDVASITPTADGRRVLVVLAAGDVGFDAGPLVLERNIPDQDEVHRVLGLI